MTPAELRRALARLEMTQSEAARRMYVSRLKIWRWYHGKTRIPGEIIALLECWEKNKDPLYATEILTKRELAKRLKISVRSIEKLHLPCLHMSYRVKRYVWVDVLTEIRQRLFARNDTPST